MKQRLPWSLGYAVAATLLLTGATWAPVPTALNDNRRSRIRSLLKDHGARGPWLLVHGYAAYHGRKAATDKFDPWAHFEVDTLLRPAHREKYVEAANQALSEGKTPPFSVVKADDGPYISPKNKRMMSSLVKGAERFERRQLEENSGNGAGLRGLPLGRPRRGRD